MASGACRSTCVETPVFCHDRTDFTEMHPMTSTFDHSLIEMHAMASTPDYADADCIGPMQQAYESKHINAAVHPSCTSAFCTKTPVFTYDTGHFVEINPVISTHESIAEDVCDTTISRRLDWSCIAGNADDISLGNKKKQPTVVQSQLNRLIGSAACSMTSVNKKSAASGKTGKKSAPEKKLLCTTPQKTLLGNTSDENTTTAIDTKDTKAKLKQPIHKTKAALAAEYKILGDKRKRLSSEIDLIAASVRVKESMLEYAELVCRQEEHKQVDDTPVAVKTHKKRGANAQKVVGTKAETQDEGEEKDDDEEDEPTAQPVAKASDDDDDEDDEDDEDKDADDAEEAEEAEGAEGAEDGEDEE